jgi:3-oxoacyl-[acyl-carrier protein] reductase
MFEDIQDKKVLITGASGGIGSSIARIFADYSACVGLHYRKEKGQATKLLKEIRGNAGKAELFQGDLLDKDARQNLVNSFVKVFGGIDILINNAGAICDYEHFSELEEKSWDYTFELNAKVPFYLSSKAFEYMKKRGGGRIINISSANVKYGGSEKSIHYSASKAALDNLTVGFARAGAEYNILVNSIRCGVIDTPMRTKIKGYSEELFKKRINLVLLKRAGKPVDIARMALFLASDAGNFVTGEILTVAGGD